MLNNKFKKGEVHDIKASALWACLGVIIGLMAFTFNYFNTSLSFPGYSVLVKPAMFALSFFSEETAFGPKMFIFVLGQYLGYFIVILSVKKLINRVR